jgi:hypothetical protein
LPTRVLSENDDNESVLFHVAREQEERLGAAWSSGFGNGGI